MQSIIQLSDAELIQAYGQGKEQALEAIIYRHKDRIYTTIYMLVKDHFVAEDLFQDTFVKIIQTIHSGRYSEQGKFLPWAIRVAHNLCMDHFRKTKPDIPITTGDGREIFQLMRFSSESAEETLVKRQVSQNVRDLIDSLPQDQKEVVILRIYGNLSFKEISELTSVSINTALGRMRYALINLRKMILKKQMVLR